VLVTCQIMQYKVWKLSDYSWGYGSAGYMSDNAIWSVETVRLQLRLRQCWLHVR